MACVHTGTGIVLVRILILLPRLKLREVGYLTYKVCQVFQGKLMIGKLYSVATSLSARSLFQGVVRHTTNQQNFAVAVYSGDVFYSLDIITEQNYQLRRIQQARNNTSVVGLSCRCACRGFPVDVRQKRT